MSPRPAKLGSLNRAIKLINAEALQWAFAHPFPTRYYIREEGGRNSLRGLCLRVGARVIVPRAKPSSRARLSRYNVPLHPLGASALPALQETKVEEQRRAHTPHGVRANFGSLHLRRN